MVERDPEVRIRALERLRALETQLLGRVEGLRRWLIRDIEDHLLKSGHGPLPDPIARLLERPEEWWRPPAVAQPTDDAPCSLLRLPVVKEAIGRLPGSCSKTYSPSDRAHDGIDLSLLLPPLLELLESRTECARQAGLET